MACHCVRCGSGLSGECLTEQAHMWIGLDISSSMLGLSHLHSTISVLSCKFLADSCVHSLCGFLFSVICQNIQNLLMELVI